MKKILYPIICSIFVLCCNISFAAKDGKVVIPSKTVITRNYEVPPYVGIKVQGTCDINFIQGAPSVALTAPDNVFDNISVEVKDGILCIDARNIIFSSKANLDFKVSCETLKSIDINGSADFEAKSGLKCMNLVINLNGAGDIEIDGFASKNLDATINGAGDIEIDRMDSEDVKITINGAGDCELEGMAEKADITINGAGTVDVAKLKCNKISTSLRGLGKIKR